MTQRSYDRNDGYINLPDIDDDKLIAGAVIILKDDYGNFSARFIAETLPGLPGHEVQETLGGMISTAYDIANLYVEER